MIESIPKILAYLPVTLYLAIIPMIIGTIIGLITALVRINKVPVLKQIAGVYVSFIRGTPLLVQLYLVYYGIPRLILWLGNSVGLFTNFDINSIEPAYYALFAFSINLGAYISETARAAIQSIDRGQFEAAYSIGLKRYQIMLYIILPQASLVALPNMGNTLISMVKDTSFAFIIMVIDIMGEAKIIGARGLRFLEVYISVSLIYWVTCIILERLITLLEKRLRMNERGMTE